MLADPTLTLERIALHRGVNDIGFSAGAIGVVDWATPDGQASAI